MKQMGEVYQPKSGKGNARKPEICVLEDVMAGRFGPKTPPHKGRDQSAATAYHFTVSSAEKFRCLAPYSESLAPPPYREGLGRVLS